MPGLYTITTRATGTTLTAAIYNADHQNHVDNEIPTMMDDYSANAAQMQSTVDPGESGSESLATSLAGELERLRFAIKDIKAAVGLTSAQWYSTPTGGGVTPTGVVSPYVGSTAPSGWVLAAGKTIGNGASGGTERANADTESLFTLLWNSMADAQAPVSGGRGASAAADFAANKTITVPDLRGRSAIGKDDMGGSAANRLTVGVSGVAGTTLGASGGSQSLHGHTHGSGNTGGQSADHSHAAGTLAADSGGAHTHPVQGDATGGGTASPFMNGLTAPGGTSTAGAATSDGAHGHSISGSTAGASGGHTHSIASEGGGSSQNIPPVVVLNQIVKL